MPIPTPPMKCTCPACGWSAVIPSRSDVILGPTACRRCGNTNLAMKKAGPLDIALSVLTNPLSRLIR